MNYQQTIDWLFQALPMYQRIGDKAIKKDLTNIRKLCAMLDKPQQHFQTIHIAGTNGKGSTSHMLAAIFQAAGKKTGLYTSPHYVDFRERIKVNGQMISKAAVVTFVEQYRAQWEHIQPSFFEITVALAFDHFRNEKVDIAIIETGLGGRLDSTNIVQPLLSVITNIGYDHMQMLGDTLPAIASEKAGIIKFQTPVVIGEWQKQTAPVFKAKAKEAHAPIHFASRHIRLRELKSARTHQVYRADIGNSTWIKRLTCDLTGPYQSKNLVTVLEAMWCWNRYYSQSAIADSIIVKALADVVTMTSMIGRWMILDRAPMTIADAAHNEHGMKAMLPRLLALPCRQRHFVLGFVGDKRITDMLSMFPADAHYYWCAPDIPRRKEVLETQTTGLMLGLKGDSYASVQDAYAAARRMAQRKDLVFVGGSSYVVGDLLASIKYKTDA